MLVVITDFGAVNSRAIDALLVLAVGLLRELLNGWMPSCDHAKTRDEQMEHLHTYGRGAAGGIMLHLLDLYDVPPKTLQWMTGHRVR